MSRKLLLGSLALGASLWLGHALVGCVGDESAPPPGADASSDVTTDTGTGAKANGVPCGAGNECQTGFCVDGVCCESKCDGVCEKCNQAPNVGSCTPIPDGQDPDNECPTTPLPDAGTPPQDSGTSDASLDSASDAPVESGSPPLNIPDGGVTLTDNQCAGKCNGKRACAYPDSTKTCGTVFCNNATQQGRAACDGKGHCLLGLEACQAYSCPIDADSGAGGPGCNKTCTGPADCLDTHYCDTSGVCKPKLANGATCASPVQCQSGHCYGAPTGVCCNDECNGFGGSCTNPGKVGQCICSACDYGGGNFGACKLWYPDRDGDGFGDKNAVYANPPGPTNARPGCVAAADGGAPPPPAAGYVEDNTDCYDEPGIGASVHPGQTAFFTSPYGPNNSFDYNCSGTVEKETPEYVGASCGFCYGSGFLLCGRNSTCSTAGQQASLACGFVGASCGNRICFTCGETGDDGFVTNVACGTAGTVYHCGSCSAQGGAAAGTTYSTVTQRCH
jgi:hypothetical protein